MIPYTPSLSSNFIYKNRQTHFHASKISKKTGAFLHLCIARYQSKVDLKQIGIFTTPEYVFSNFSPYLRKSKGMYGVRKQ